MARKFREFKDGRAHKGQAMRTILEAHPNIDSGSELQKLLFDEAGLQCSNSAACLAIKQFHADRRRARKATGSTNGKPAKVAKQVTRATAAEALEALLGDGTRAVSNDDAIRDIAIAKSFVEAMGDDYHRAHLALANVEALESVFAK